MTDRDEQLEGRALQAEGIALVLSNEPEEWKAAYRNLAEQIPNGWEGIGDEFHRWCRAQGLPKPHHPNCWGANWVSLVKSKPIRFQPTGEHKFSITKTVRREERVWRKID